MKFSSYLWSLYKASAEGQKVIKQFSEDRDIDADLLLIEEYCPRYIKSQEQKESLGNLLDALWAFKVGTYGEREPNAEDAGKIFDEIIASGFIVDGEIVFKPEDYAQMLNLIPLISIELNAWCRDVFLPYLYIERFYDLKKLADYYEIDLPNIPKKSDYRGRCLYYWELCKVFHQFMEENGLSMPELCAFIYDYAPKRMNQEEYEPETPQPAQAWFIGGLIQGYGEQWTTAFWQSSIETKKGDILIHYETSPVSAITCLWIAQTDGVLDPFFIYYSNTYIGNRIETPRITLKELKADAYFSKHPLVRKSFQGVNGWPVTGEDYTELMRMIQAKGFDTTQLPKLYAPTISKDITIKTERDVEQKLLEPLLNSMGLHENQDFIRQLPIHAGRGHRIYPDYALHYDAKTDEERASVLIEAKLLMKNNQEIEDAYLQARSYAMLLDSSVIVLCDKDCLITYQKMQSFDRDRYRKYYWKELENPDKYSELKQLFGIR